jgi:hypothetical protein
MNQNFELFSLLFFSRQTLVKRAAEAKPVDSVGFARLELNRLVLFLLMNLRRKS